MWRFARQALFFAGALAVGAAFGAAMGNYMKGALVKPDVRVLALLPGLAILAIALHELGHAVGGWVSGFELHLFTAGPLRLERQGRRLRWLFNRDARLWGGLAATIPPASAVNDGQALRRGMFRMTAGGPLFSLLGSLLLLPALVWRDSEPNLALICLMAGTLSLAIMLATLIPMSAGGYVSDGGRLLQLLRNRDEGRRWCLLAVLGALSTSQRPRDWPAALMGQLEHIPATSYDGLMALWLRHNHHADREQWTEARATLDAALDNAGHWPASARGLIHLSAAYFHAAHAGDAAAARLHLEKARQPGLLSRDELHLVEAAVLRAEGRHQEALEAAARAEQALAGKSEGAAAPAREFLQTLRAAS
jgi:hypothetical protein